MLAQACFYITSSLKETPQFVYDDCEVVLPFGVYMTQQMAKAQQEEKIHNKKVRKSLGSSKMVKAYKEVTNFAMKSKTPSRCHFCYYFYKESQCGHVMTRIHRINNKHLKEATSLLNVHLSKHQELLHNLNALSVVKYEEQATSTITPIYQKFLDDIKAHMDIHLPDFEIAVFGGMSNGFGGKASDVDLSVQLKGKLSKEPEGGIRQALVFVFSLFKNNYVRQQMQIDSVNRYEKGKLLYFTYKVFDEETSTRKKYHIDVTFYNFLGVANSRLQLWYASLDDRVKQLAFLVKNWAKANRLYYSGSRKFNSYSLNLMVIHYLQKGVYPAVVPNLHKYLPNPPIHWAEEDKIKMDIKFYYEPPHEVERRLTGQHYAREIMKREKLNIDWKTANTMSVMELFCGFMMYYSQFNFSTYSINIHESHLIGRQRNYYRDGHEKPVFICCPVGGENPARSLIPDNFKLFHKTVREFCQTILLLKPEYSEKQEKKLIKLMGLDFTSH